MYFVKKTPLEKRLDLQKKLKTGKLIRFPGAYNPLVAKLIEEIGY
ncbi:MAG: methylisocitrate lyase, partial [Candidatus Fonsibacter ubiquis]|nr:methylisocitrate lyase [Candidatus Fonsibacter ubiquis]NCU68852.1 methylisocitrate lyase [Candidatus Fonsibacter ubiquis]